MTRYIILGDIHGCGTELDTLLNKIGIVSDDIIISLGDVTDKGPDSHVALDILDQHNAILVEANHDTRYKKYFNKGLSISDVRDKKIDDKYKDEYEKIMLHPFAMRYLASSVPFTEVEVAGQLFTFVHAGVTPYMDLYDINKAHWGEFLRVRYLNAETHSFIRMVKVDKDMFPDEVESWRPEYDNVIEWQRAYDARYGIIVHGHIIVGPNPHMWVGDTVDNTQKVEIDRTGERFEVSLLKAAKTKAFSLDTGAHKGWNLTAMIIEEDSGQMYFEQVEVNTCYEP